MKLTLGYSTETDLVPLKPLLEGKINRDVVLETIKVKEDELKFMFSKFDLIYVPLPLINYIQDIKFLSNAAKVTDRIGLKGKCDDKVCVSSSNSTEYYYLKMFETKLTVSRGSDCECYVSTDEVDEDLTAYWRKKCNDAPIILKLIAVNLDEADIAKIKIAIRESASIMASQNAIPQYSKELGLKGRKGVECFFDVCREVGLCSNNKYSIL